MTPDSLVKTTDLLAQLTRVIEETLQHADSSERPPPRVFMVYLASFFQSNVDQGGFAQLFYNAKGENLAEIDDMLATAGASVAHQSYQQAVELCLDSLESYQEFLRSDFLSQSDLKNALHAVSIEYFRQGSSFLAEAADFIEASREPVDAWVRSQAPV